MKNKKAKKIQEKNEAKLTPKEVKDLFAKVDLLKGEYK